MGILRRPVLLGLFLLVLTGSQTAFGYAVPHYLNVQGVLRNVAGDLVTGTYQVYFKVYDAETAGNLIWSSGSTPLSVQVSTGVFNVYLGEFTTNIFAPNATRWLEIQVNGDTALARKQITAVGYAFTAERAVTADSVTGAAPDVACGTACISPSEVTFNYAGSLSQGGPASDVACEAAGGGTGCIGSAEIVDGSIATADIGNSQVTSAKLASSIDISGSFSASTVLVKNSLYTGAAADSTTERLTNSGALKNITTLNMSGVLTNSVATGVAPMVLNSTTKVANLNADLLDGNDTTFFTNASNLSNGTIPAARLPIAGGAVGAVKSGGTGISIAADGTISNTGAISVSGTAPVVATPTSGAVVVSMPAATDSVNGYLTASDHATFAAFGSNKLSSVALKANDATYTDGAASLPFVGNGTAGAPLGMYKASSTYSGWLSKGDWATFNGKAPASGSGSYIQNQSAADQSANLRISGTAIVGALVTGGVATTAPVAEIQIGDPYTYVASNWGAAYRQGVMVGQDTDNVWFGLVDGAAANDSRGAIIFGDDTDDYFSFQRNDSNSAKTELMRILYGGTVGIGTTTPNAAYKLDVGGKVNASELCINGSCQTNWSTVTSLWSQSSTNLYPNSTATNVIVGGTSAASGARLTVVGGGIAVDNATTFYAKDASGAYVQFMHPRWLDNTMYIDYHSGLHFRNSAYAETLYLAADKTATFNNSVYVNGGDIFLSDTAGATKFQIKSYDSSNSLWLMSPTSTSKIVVGTAHDWDKQVAFQYTPGTSGANGGDLVIGQVNKNAGGWTQGFLRLFAAGGEHLRIHNNGNVGINHTAPANSLHVGGAIAATDWIGAGCEGACESSGGYAILYAHGQGVFSKSGSIGGGSDPGQGNLYVANAIGINDATPSYNLDVAGTGRFTGHLSANTIGSVGNITTCGGMVQTGTCPAPFTSVTAQIGRQKICMTAQRYGGGDPGGYLGAQQNCFADGGHICTQSELFMLADKNGTDTNGIGIAVGEWMGMRYSDDNAFITNANGTRGGTPYWSAASGFNFDGASDLWQHRYYHCCFSTTYNP